MGRAAGAGALSGRAGEQVMATPEFKASACPPAGVIYGWSPKVPLKQ
jgi:hypothetical protein